MSQWPWRLSPVVRIITIPAATAAHASGFQRQGWRVMSIAPMIEPSQKPRPCGLIAATTAAMSRNQNSRRRSRNLSGGMASAAVATIAATKTLSPMSSCSSRMTSRSVATSIVTSGIQMAR